MALPENMKAWRIHEFGGAEKLVLDTLPMPSAGTGELLVKVAVASVNPIDWKMRSGHLQAVYKLTLPRILGRDCAGTVVASGSPGFKPGDRVVCVADAAKDGTQAEYVVVPAVSSAKIPDAVSFEESVAFAIAGISAWQPLVEIAKVGPGMKVLVQAGAGGVGSIGVQLARHFGADVSATCGPKNVEFVRGLGATRAIDYTKEDFVQAGPFDVVFDTVGGEVHRRGYAALRPGGLFVYINAGPIDARRPREDVRTEQAVIKATSERMGRQLELAARGAIRGQVGQVFSFEDARQAFDAVQTGHGRGKTMIRMD